MRMCSRRSNLTGGREGAMWREAASQLVERRKPEQDVLSSAPAKSSFQRLLYRMVALLTAFFLSYLQ